MVNRNVRGGFEARPCGTCYYRIVTGRGGVCSLHDVRAGQHSSGCKDFRVCEVEGQLRLEVEGGVL